MQNQTAARKAIYIITDSCWRNNSLYFGVCSKNCSYRRSVSLVYIRHSQRCPDNSRQEGHIRHLLQGLIVADIFEQFLIGVDEPWHAHARLIRLGDLPAV